LLYILLNRHSAIPFLQAAQVLFRLQRRSAAGAGSSHGLLVDAIRYVARDENAGMFAFREMPNEQITVGIRFEFSFERLGVWIVTDRDENAGDWQLALFMRLDVAQHHGGHFPLFIRKVFCHHGVPDRLDFFAREHAVCHDF